MIRVAKGNRDNTGENLKTTLLGVLPAELGDILLLPWRLFYWRRRRKLAEVMGKRVISELLERDAPIYLELGSWKRPGMEGWIVSDIDGSGDLQLDLLQPIPFPDASIDKIYSSHILEHFSYPIPMLNLLRECYRILKPGGIFSVAVPDARIFIDAYYDDEEFDTKKFCSYDVGLGYRNKIDYMNFIAYMGGEHKHLFDKENLIDVMEEAGFVEAVLRQFDPSIDLEQRRHESIYAVGIK